MDACDPAITRPPHTVPMLEWWRGIYEHVFIAMHPFYGVRRADGQGREVLYDWNERPKDYETILKSRGEAVSWEAVRQTAAPDVPRQAADLAIWLMACCGYQKRAAIALQERLLQWAEAERLYFPQEDGMSSVMEPGIGRFLAKFRAREVTAFDEFREHSTVFPLSAFEADQQALRMPQHTTSYAIWGLHLPDPGVLLTWKSDGVEALIAMTARARSLAPPEEHFEGWYAYETTYSDVFNPKDFLSRKR
jgi:hypothetical protein